MVKIPALLIHFRAHLHENPELDLLEFIHAHYCQEHFHCDQHQQDQSLPFQACDFHAWQVTSSDRQVFDFQCTSVPCEGVLNGCYVAEGIESLAFDIWQPPKI
jgi:hypothetical protein